MRAVVARSHGAVRARLSAQSYGAAGLVLYGVRPLDAGYTFWRPTLRSHG
jgi:hypothetical protein